MLFTVQTFNKNTTFVFTVHYCTIIYNLESSVTVNNTLHVFVFRYIAGRIDLISAARKTTRFQCLHV